MSVLKVPQPFRFRKRQCPQRGHSSCSSHKTYNIEKCKINRKGYVRFFFASVLSPSGDLDTLIVKKVNSVAFIAIVNNCAAQVSKKSKKLDIISAAENVLELQDFCR